MHMDEWRNRVVEEKLAQALLRTPQLQLNSGKDGTDNVNHGMAAGMFVLIDTCSTLLSKVSGPVDMGQNLSGGD
jgi:hypothetical protein